MNLHVYAEIEQGTEAWDDVRRGIVTASVVADLITPATMKTANNETVRKLTHLLVAQRITGWTDPTWSGMDMERGHLDEPLARDAYRRNYAPVETVGFVIRDDWGFPIGASPDGLVGNDGGIEVKCPRSKEHLRTVLADAVPSQYIGQIQCTLLVTGRSWWDYVSFCAGMKLWTKRVFPDPEWHEAIVEAVRVFEQNAADMADRYYAATESLPMTERPDYIEV